MNSPLHWITVFGLGHRRPASGTWGSMPPVIVASGLVLAGLGPADAPWLFRVTMLLIALVFSAACVLQGDAAEARYGKDPSEAVADETAGQAIVLACLPSAGFTHHLYAAATLAIAFVAFRVFDILKPWPARQVQRVPAGWGILLDDLFAAIYAGAAAWLFVWGALR